MVLNIGQNCQVGSDKFSRGGGGGGRVVFASLPLRI